MADDKVPVRRGSSAPVLFSSPVSALSDLPAGPHWFGSARGVAERNTQFVEQHAAYLTARKLQSDALASLLDSRITVAAKLADLENVLVELQQQKNHERWRNACARESERMQAAFDYQIAGARKEAELAKARESVIRAQRNCEAADRVKELEIDAWYAEAQSRKNNAQAEFQDTAADLNRVAATANPDAIKDAAAAELARLFSTLDHQIELEKQRGNHQAALALQNLRARLKAAA